MDQEEYYRLNDAYLLAFLISHEEGLRDAVPNHWVKPDDTYSVGFDFIYYRCDIQYLLDHDIVSPQWSLWA